MMWFGELKRNMSIKGKVLVFAPHPDDETLGCGGTIAKKLTEGYEVIVVVLTDGRQAFSKIFGITSDPTPEELKQIRKGEAIKAMNALGLSEKNIIFLNFKDGSLAKHEEEVKRRIFEIIKRHPPIEIYFPYSKDYNPDHKVTNRIIKQCIKETKATAKSLQYSISQKYARIGPMIDKLVNLFKRHIVEVDISEFAPLKKKAIEQYKSQVLIISKHQTQPVLSKERIKQHLNNKELFYRI